MEQELVVLDPGTRLSLSAAKVTGIVARGCGVRFVVVHTGSCDGLTALEEPEDIRVKKEILAGSQQIGLLLRYAMNATEDEAAAAAFAEANGFPLISDEPKLRKAFAERVNGPNSLMSLPELFRRWEARTPNQTSSIAAVIGDLRAKAFYVLPPSLPGADWWRAHVAQTPAV